jgi:hypothetical protein
MNGNIRAITLTAGVLLAVTGCSSSDDSNSGGAPPPASSVSVAADTTTTSADDLRGLTYSRVGANAGKIYASGHVGTDNATRQAVVARFNTDGSPDTTFGGDGFVELGQATSTLGPATGTNNDETSLGIAELQSGDVVVTVNAAEAAGQSVYLFRVTPAGVTRRASSGPAGATPTVKSRWCSAVRAAPATRLGTSR